MNSKKIFPVLIIVLFIIITILNISNHTPWNDEAGAWLLAKDMNFNNILFILHNEGHFIIWYLLLMPFAKFDISYPYPMLIINWLAYLFAIIIMWKKAPFNNIAKIIITFSWLSLNYFSVVARCYSIGILGLFILMSLYEHQLKRPYLYSIMLVLTAHTSLLATLPVVPLTCIFVYNLFKNQKELTKSQLFYPLIILSCGIFLWFLPFLNGYNYNNFYVNVPAKYKHILNFFKYNYYIMLYCYIISYIFILLFANNKIRFFAIATVMEYLIFFSFIYSSLPHHTIFLIIYMILSFWLVSKLHKLNVKTILFFIPFTILLFFDHTYHMNYIIQTPDKSHIIEYINSTKTKNNLIYTGWGNINIMPFIKNTKYLLIDPLCLEDQVCANEQIQFLLKNNRLYSTIYVLTPFPIDINSKLFEYIQGTANIKIYVTKFEQPNIEKFN